MLACVGIACLATATVHATHYKMLLCAGNNGSNGYGTSTNTISPNNPGGIFSFENYCGPAPDPAGNAAHLRIVENQAGGNAGNGAYGFMYWDTPPYVHYKTAGGWTRLLIQSHFPQPRDLALVVILLAQAWLLCSPDIRRHIGKQKPDTRR